MTHCPICENTKFNKLFTSGGKTIERCSKCGLTHTKDFKVPNYTKYHRDSDYKNSEKFFSCIFKTRFNIISKLKRSGRVLDIGSATGVMLDIFKQHKWETYGIEPSESYQISKEKGHHIYHCTLENATLPKNYFDVIVVNHVLEHITTPNQFLAICKSSLKKDGIIYIDVPNFGSLSSTIAGSSWKYILPKEHVYHFTPKTLTLLLTKNGLKVKYKTTRSGVFEAENPIKYLLLELFSFKKNFFYDLVTFPTSLFSTLINKGSSLGIIACEE